MEPLTHFGITCSLQNNLRGIRRSGGISEKAGGPITLRGGTETLGKVSAYTAKGIMLR